MEIRCRETFLSMIIFGILLLFLFQFSFEILREKTEAMAPGLLWLAFIFTGTLGFTHLFQVEKENNCIEALLLSPMDRGALFAAKVLFNVLLMLLVELVIFPLFGILFNLNYWHLLPLLLGASLLGTIGFCVLGTLCSAVTLNSRARELLLPMILFPLMIPIFLGTIRSIELIIHESNFQELVSWLGLLIGFDIIFLTVGFLIFEWIIEG